MSWFKPSIQDLLKHFTPQQPQQKVQEILASLKQEMPTPCLMLVGEPQVGKSSIVRSLTQDPNAHIGEGDGIPVTAGLHLYHFPPNEFPLWTFIDTPGLGGCFDPQERTLLEHFLQGQNVETAEGEKLPAPHLVLLCVRVDDTALNILPKLEQLLDVYAQQSSHKPPLLVVQTCLHRILHPHPSPYPFGQT
ncbi:MAG: GTPase, partial [Myxococcota bacterium]